MVQSEAVEDNFMRPVLKSVVVRSFFVSFTVCPAAALGQSVVDVSATDYLSSLAALSDAVGRTAPVASPRDQEGNFASTVGIPSGFVMPRGSAFVAAAISDTRERIFGQGLDGSAAIGLGFGNAASGLGFEATLGISSVSPHDFGDSGSIDLKYGTAIPSPFAGGVAGLSLGVTRAIAWGEMENEDAGIYFVASSTFDLPLGRTVLPGLISLGYGTNIGTSEGTDGAIFGVGVALMEELSFGVSWYGDELVAGATLRVQMSRSFGAQIGVSYGDVLQENSNGRWVLSVSLLSLDLF